MSDPTFFDSRPVARSTDPETSHQAAASVTNLTEKQDAVLDCLRTMGPSTDQMIQVRYANLFSFGHAPRQSGSGLRTRRAELVRKGLVRDTGERVTLSSGRKAIVWEVTPNE